MPDQKLKDKVALVAGATRGAGRGIACMLGEAGATVYCSGRSTREHPCRTGFYAGRPETIDETAEMVTSRGGVGIAVQTDHTNVNEVRRLIERIEGEHGRLDVLVNDIWGGDSWMDWWWKLTKFWEIPLEKGFEVMNTAVNSHIITAHEAIPLMLKAKKGLIVEMTDGDGFYYRGQFYYDYVKTTVIRMAMAWAIELRKEGIASVAITPGFLRSESILDQLGVTEVNWRDAVKKRPEFAESETPFYVGRAIAALAADPRVMQKSGRVFNSAELAREYGFTDVDGRKPMIWQWFKDNLPRISFKKIDDTFYSYVAADYVKQPRRISRKQKV